MWRTTAKTAWSHKRRLAGTALAVVLGVAFLSATLVLGASGRAGFETAFEEATAGTDAYVRSAAELTSGEQATRLPIDAQLLADVAAVDGVAAAVPTVEGFGQALDADGDPIGGGGPPTMAEAWVDDPALSAWDLAEGRAPQQAGEVVVDRGTAEDADVSVGDPLTVLVPSPIEVTVVGIATFGDEDSIGGSTYVAFPFPEAQELLLGGTDRITGVIAAAEDGVGEEELVRRVREVLPADAEALTGTRLAEELEEQIEGDFLGFFTTALTAFALIALLVAALSIFNTFTIIAAQRTRESALLRAIGASRRQVLVSALAESAIVGVVGAAAGAVAGVGVAAGALSLMRSAGFGMPGDGVEIGFSSLLTAALVGFAVTIVGGAVPAWRASRVAPLAALREVAVDASGASRARAAVGIGLTTVGVALVATAGEIALVGVGGALTMVGVIVFGPVVAGPVGRLLGAPLRLRGVSGDLARRNAVRNPRRTAATATALLVGIGIVSLFTVFGASLGRSIEDQVDRTFGGELALTPAGWSGAGLSPDLVADVADLDEVEAAAGLGFGPGTLDGRQQGVGFTDPAALASVATFELLEGDIAEVGDGDVALADDYADEHGYGLGDRVELGLPDGATSELTVGAIYDPGAMGGDVLVTDSLWTAHASQASYYMVLVGLADGTSLDEGRAAVEVVTAPHGAPDVMDREEFVEAQAAEIDVLLTVVYALLAIAIVIALMGIASTLSLSVHERTRELGLLRAVGQTRSQLRAMVRWESAIVAVFGSIGGVGLGVFLSWGLVRSLNAEEGWGSYAVPFGSLVVIVAIGAAVGILAGLRPAWRAGKLDVLDAVATD